MSQIRSLVDEGCEIIRSAVPDEDSVAAFREIKNRMRSDGIVVPFVADIHFDHRLALGAIDAGADKIRFNPGNIGPPERAIEVATAAKNRGIPIRVGVNAGSLRKEHQLPDHSHDDRNTALARALADSALWGVELLDSVGHEDVIVSAKASSVPVSIEAYRLLANECDKPLHIGVTEAGTTLTGAIKSAVGLGVLMSEGIGDTFRVSLATDPVTELGVAFNILSSLGIRRRGANVIACPTCSRCDIDLIPLAEAVELELKGVKEPIDIAVMGCVVNGPGEAREADLGIAAGKGEGLLFKNGEIVDKVPEGELLVRLREAIAELISSRS